ncbi:MAG: hypothetical protein R2766_13565 [Saprospiraceae bacterium]
MMYNSEQATNQTIQKITIKTIAEFILENNPKSGDNLIADLNEARWIDHRIKRKKLKEQDIKKKNNYTFVSLLNIL